MNNKRIEEIKERLELTTEGNWDDYFEQGVPPMIITYKDIGKGQRSLDKFLGRMESPYDLAFVANSKSDIEFLIAEIESLEQKLSKATKALSDIANHNTLDGNKYNNFIAAYLGVVEFSAKALKEIGEE